MYLATDPDREGEAIAWHVTQHLTGDNASEPSQGADRLREAAAALSAKAEKKKPKARKGAKRSKKGAKEAEPEVEAPVAPGPRFHRVLLREITKDAVAEAIASAGVIDDHKVEAQQARRILDRLVGYKASPLLWKSVKTGLSAGRVQTVALRLIVERENEIRAFKPQEYWTIEALLEAQGKKFTAKLAKIDGKKPELPNADAATGVITDVTGKPFVVSEVQRKERRKHPVPPFTTSTLQQESAKQLGYSSRRTMRLAQDLYEGIEIGSEGAVGLITYMRTDSTRVAPVAIDAVRAYIKAYFEDPRYLPEKPNTFAAKKSSRVQDAHEAIRPSDVNRRPESVKQYLSPEQFRLYELIWRRFVASQMAATVYDTTTIDFEVGKYLFRATGSVVIFDGYHAVYREGREAEDGKTLDDLAPVPPLEKGNSAAVHEVKPSQHFTEPPPRFSEASLVKELERLGIGRPSTYSSIIGTLRAREYVDAKDRRFHPTDLGETVTKVMVSRFPDIFNVAFTSAMEDELDKVEEGELKWRTVLSDFYTPFEKALAAVDTDELIKEAHGLDSLDLEKCPEDGGQLRVRSGRFGPFIACVNYPTCKYTKPLKRDKPPDRPTDQICKVCSAPMVIKTGRYGEFLACTKYPECKHTRPIPLGVKCPKCGDGELAERRTKRGRSFFGCGNYPACDFSTWYRPVPDTCPECSYLGAEKRYTKGRGEYRRCLKCQTEWGAPEGAEATVTT
ncbi:MAG: type I DNA topoisomerase [Gemmatimonadetes bacterium]|nr:type I DNA topoisomerase [Gemmatimonadota bacterium]